MTAATNLEELQRLSEKVTGKPSTADSIADAIAEIADGYSGSSGGGGATVTGVYLYPDSEDIIQSGKVELSDGTTVEVQIVKITKFTVISSEGSSVNMTSLTVNNTLGSGNSYRYDFNRKPSIPAIGEDVSDLPIWDGVSDIEAEDGSGITVIEADANGKVVKAGYTDVTIKY